MKKNKDKRSKYAKLGKPSLVFGKGQKRRLNLVEKEVDLQGKKVLDVGCGTGSYGLGFVKKGAEYFGIDIDEEKIKEAKENINSGIFKVSSSENIPFPDEFFDVVFLNEVLEHVKDDEETVVECLRVLKNKGHIVVFAPNRFFPFETHGIYLGKKYIFGNIPLINYLPLRVRNFFCPHVRVYTPPRLKEIFPKKEVSFSKTDFVLPAFDRIERKIPFLGRFLKKITPFFEKSFLKVFGISVFLIAQKNEKKL